MSTINNAVATKLANAVTIHEFRDGFESTASIVSAIDLGNNTSCARVVSGENVLLDWISATPDTIRAAEKMVCDRVAKMNAELDAKLEN